MCVAVAQLGGQTPEPLFAEIAGGPTLAEQMPIDPRPFHVRSRTAVLRIATLQRALAAPAASPFALNLFDDATFPVTFERSEDSGLGHRTWVGHITNRPLSTVILTVSGDFVTGIVRDDTTMFEIAGLGGGVHRIDQLNTSAMPRTRDTVLGPPGGAVAEELHKDPAPSMPAAVPGVDILVYYSTGVRIQAGGTAQAEALAARYVAESNTAYARSGVNGQVRLLGALEVPAPDGANAEALLPSLRAHPLVQSHRHLGGADLVALLLTHIESTMPDFIQCGFAYIGPGIDAAFSVTATRSECDAGYLFTHEIGHNLGAQHATEDGVVIGPHFPLHARGYKAPNRTFRTMMTYPCQAGPDCPVILNFSNPNVLAPPPIPGGQPTGTPSQHNAHRLNELFPFVSSYRAARIPPSAPQSLQGSVSGSTVNLSWVAPAAGGSPSGYLLDAGTAPGLSNLAAGLPFGETSLSAPGVPPGTYFLRVRARNAGGVSGPSNEVSIVVQ